jgi:large conductance mechanosensitive channel
MSGFRKFLMRGNLIDLAVAVVMGVAFNAIVQALIKDLITPLISAITGGKKPKNFAAYTFTLHGSAFHYGDFINALVSFIVIASVVYFLLVAPATKLVTLTTKAKAATDRQCPECLSQIPIQAKRCMYCTSEVPPAPVPEVDPSVPILRRARHRSLASE